ncbi:MAG: hypothetical protein H0T79_24040, partial [Deltaproteobacteria bacterium]|nr:hypothetical protein [Deltaproteobacteria bacterium]
MSLLLVAVALLALGGSSARAESCTGVTGSGGRFATCFDPGNRLSLTAGSDGFGGGIALRHLVKFDDDPDLAWKLEHTILEARHAGFEPEFAGVLYRGRFIRHTRDGRLVLPLGTPKTIFLPFDIGAQIEAGRVTWRDEVGIRIGIVKTAALVDLWRSRDFRRRL